MDDYLASEQEQWEWLKAQIREYGPWILGGIALGALGIFGWLGWQQHVDKVGREASAKYQQMADAFNRNDSADGMRLLGELEREYSSSPYVDQGKLVAAQRYVDSGDLDKASRELQEVVQHSKDANLALLSRLRLARVQISQQKPDDALATLSGTEPGAFAPRFHEVRGDAYYAKGDKANALKEYRTARASDLSGVTDNSLLDLKIADLVADAGPAPSTPTADSTLPKPAK